MKNVYFHGITVLLLAIFWVVLPTFNITEERWLVAVATSISFGFMSLHLAKIGVSNGFHDFTLRILRDHLISIKEPPFAKLRRFTQFIFPKKVNEKIFAQQLEDALDEYLEALDAGRVWHARFIAIRERIGFVLTVISYLSASVIKKMVTIFKTIG